MITGVLGCAPISIDSKTNAIQYAISLSTSTDKNSKIGVDLVLAAGIYNFITERVELPDLPKNVLAETYGPLAKTIKDKLEKLGD